MGDGVFVVSGFEFVGFVFVIVGFESFVVVGKIEVWCVVLE